MSKLILIALLSSSLGFAADLAPALGWVTVAGGAGTSNVSAAVADPQGNLYITGSTTAVDISAITATPVRSSPDAYVMKLDPNGAVVYTTYFGGTGSDGAAAIALGPGGAIYIAGATQSADLPVTQGAYSSTPPPKNGAATFVLKLNASGTVEWATYFPEITVEAIAVDAAGSPYIGGRTAGGGSLPTTPGAYNTDFKQTIGSNGFFSTFGPLSAYVTKFSPDGKSLVYSTYVPYDRNGLVIQEARALAVDAGGNAWIGTAGGNSIATGSFIHPSVVELNSTGSGIVASAGSVNFGDVSGLAFDADLNVYIAGAFDSPQGFPATPGAFQPGPQPGIMQLPGSGQPQAGGGGDAFVAKWNHDLTTLLAATLLGGEGVDSATSIAIDNTGNVIVGGSTASRAFPTHAPFQTSFSTNSGFAAALDSDLTTLSFSTFLGDTRPFTAQAVIPDRNGNLLVAGNTLTTGNGLSGTALGVGNLIVANKIALVSAPTPRLDSIQHYISRLAQPIAPGEPLMILGSGLSGASVLLDGAPLTSLTGTDTWLVTVAPDTVSTTGAHTVQISNKGALSNAVFVPAAAASPGVYTTSAYISGEAYVFNADGTPNSSSNPASPGTAITIYAAGAGRFTKVGPYAVTDLLPAVFIDGFYCSGIAATIEPVNGFPGNVFKLSVFVPTYADLIANNPDLKNYKFHPQSALKLQMGPGSPYATTSLVSQNGVYINIKP